MDGDPKIRTKHTHELYEQVVELLTLILVVHAVTTVL